MQIKSRACVQPILCFENALDFLCMCKLTQQSQLTQCT